ncbi:MAG: M1 family metallopeptidase [Flavobacteriales bacterium]|nr:M1 family metallopeptidase [Flavobacteriales bacterium]
MPLRPTLLLLYVVPLGLCGQLGNTMKTFTRADTLRGSIGPERAWWNALHYDVRVKPDFASRGIQGHTTITFEAIDEGKRMQIDLQQPLVVDSIVAEISTFWDSGGGYSTPKLDFDREGDVLWVDFPKELPADVRMPVHVYYHGVPRAAKNPPWDGGWVWAKDPKGHPWMTVACQGLGASVWYPCKDHQSDEPDNGATLRITVPDSLQAIGNGRLKGIIKHGDGTSTWHWSVSSPINTYNLVPYIGKYSHFGEVYDGLDGPLDLDYWVIAGNEEKARRQFAQVPGMLACFEEWFGPFPFYSDGFKLVESPHLGMEHQSAIAYGNRYVNGYMGQDLSGTGHGLHWDYIIVHESGHEWYGNNITTADIADMWVHEGFTMYSEVLHVECTKGLEAAREYARGVRRNISNDGPVIGPYGVNKEGSGDMYPKGANVVHMVRRIMDDDTAFKTMLRDMNRDHRHGIVTSAMIEAYMDQRETFDLRPLFAQYLRDVRIPMLQWGRYKGRAYLRWTNTIEGFSMPLRFRAGRAEEFLEITTLWSAPEGGIRRRDRVEPDPDWYIGVERIPTRTLKKEVSLAPKRYIKVKP